MRPLLGTEGLIVVLGAVVLMFLLHRRLSWLALVLLVLGFVGALLKRPDLIHSLNLTLWKPGLAQFDNTTLAGIWRGGLMQIPLTLLNSVFAVSALAVGLFPEQRERNTPARIAISVGLMNLVACPFGGMPMCHGSGGLAAQYRFGARTGMAMVFLGSMMLFTGFFFGPMAMAVMQAFPSAILSVFLFEAGLGLALASRFWETPSGIITTGVMVCLYWATGNILLAFAIAWIVHWIVGNRDIRKLLEKPD
jgi:MFS superfamily sulfate permease-like transporter